MKILYVPNYDKKNEFPFTNLNTHKYIIFNNDTLNFFFLNPYK